MSLPSRHAGACPPGPESRAGSGRGSLVARRLADADDGAVRVPAPGPTTHLESGTRRGPGAAQGILRDVAQLPR